MILRKGDKVRLTKETSRILGIDNKKIRHVTAEDYEGIGLSMVKVSGLLGWWDTNHFELVGRK